MASSSQKSATKANLLGKRQPEGDLETKSFLKRHKEEVTTKEQIEGSIELSETKSDEANLISVEGFSAVPPPEDGLETKSILKRHKEQQIEGSVELSEKKSDEAYSISAKDRVEGSAAAPEHGLETISILKRHKEEETTKEHIQGSVELSETKSVEANLISVKDTFQGFAAAETVGGLDDFAKELAVPKKTVFVANLPPKTVISDIIDFFRDVGQVVRVQLIVDKWSEHVGCGFVEFAAAYQAKKALRKKNGDSLHKSKIFLHVAKKGTRCIPSKFCIDHKVWYKEDYLQQQESLAIRKYETPPTSVKESAVLFVANLSPQTTKITHVIDFFEDVGNVVSVRLIVNQVGQHVGYGFVEFPSARQAKWALENKNGEYLHDHKIFLMKGLDETPDFAEAVAKRNKTLFVANLCPELTKISHIINFFKDVGEVVHVRLIVNHRCMKLGFGYVEFASAHEAEKALEKKNYQYLNNREIFLRFAKTDEDSSENVYCIDHKVWYEEHFLQPRESLLIEDAAVERRDETPDCAEDVASRQKTVFVADLTVEKKSLCNILDIISFFKYIGEVVRVRQIVDHWGEHVGCCYVEFASANEAKKAVQNKKKSRRFFVNLAKLNPPYPFRLIRYKLIEKLWYEDRLRRDDFGLANESKLKKEPVIPSGKKITFCDED